MFAKRTTAPDPDPRQHRLPDRVRATIRQQQNAGKQLVGWLQLAVVLLFGDLYTAAPKTFTPDSPFEPVPWFLSIYLLLTIGRLVLAYRRSPPARSRAGLPSGKAAAGPGAKPGGRPSATRRHCRARRCGRNNALN